MLWVSSTFTSPPWTVTPIDDEAVEHSRPVGGFVPAEEIEPLTVGIVQRDELMGDDALPDLRRGPAQVRVAGMRLSPAETRHLILLLTTATVMIAGPCRRDPRSRNGGFGLAPSPVGLFELDWQPTRSGVIPN